MKGLKVSRHFANDLILLLLALGIYNCAGGCAPDLGPIGNGDKEVVVAKDGDGGGETSSGECTGEAPLCAEWETTIGEGEEATTFVPGANGVCKDIVGVASCDGSDWICTFEGVDLLKDDADCDGVDSDCDGVPDEEEVPPTEVCVPKAGLQDGALVGVCADLTVVCVEKDGSRECNFGDLYVEDEEFDSADLGRWCDGLDNDCDGEEDEGMFSGKGYIKDHAEPPNFSFGDCPEALVGVCDGKKDSDEGYTGALMMKCDNKKLKCAYECGEEYALEGDLAECTYDDTLIAAGYEQTETLCDGLDNDCNGTVDDVSGGEASGCPYQGVCKGKVEAVCKDLDDDPDEIVPGWVCIFDNSLHLDPDFEYQVLSECAGEPGCGAETKCDGLDNDCDGLVDEGLVWPQECFTQSADGTIDYHCDDDDLPQCALNHPECEGATALEFEDCPVLEKKAFDGVTASVPAVTDAGLPLLPGVCAPDGDGLTNVRYSCVAIDIDADEEPDTNVWECNYALVESYFGSESGADVEWCDGLDNNCDTIVDGEVKPNGSIVYISTSKSSPHVPCRTLGACDGNWKATCNMEEPGKEGTKPGQWYCEYTDVSDMEMVDPNNPDCDAGYANCLWAETLCDGLDNDCDGLVDELLDGYKVDLEAACGGVMGVGVCEIEGLNTVCAQIGDSKGFACDFSGIEFYAPVEESVGGEAQAEFCDGRDNDCDGAVDEDIGFFSPTLHEEFNTGCGFKGVCAVGNRADCAPSAPPVEGEANWECDHSGLSNAYHNGQVNIDGQSTEVLCDGLDNDCDGFIDEGLSQDLPGAGEKNPLIISGCPQKGICAGVMKWSCDVVDGESVWVCDPSDVGGAYELEETHCDGIDNDCNGAADEGLVDPGENGANCKSLGVCGEGGVIATCISEQGQAAWNCNYEDGVVGYDGLVETTCDGLDNDCDGFIDEEVDWEVSNGCTLSQQGVCNSPLLQATCKGTDGWTCHYDLIAEYKVDEKLCDQLDNDCDGLIDEQSCDVCEPCTDLLQCKSGNCHLAPGELGEQERFCSAGKDYCVYRYPYSLHPECESVKSGDAACADETTAVLCGAGAWFGKAVCSGNKPVCWEGDCVACVPGSLTCDANTAKECNASGSGWADKTFCAGGTVCIGAGVCVVNEEFEVSTTNLSSQQSLDTDPKIVPSVGGGFVVVYTGRAYAGGAQTDVLWRKFNAAIAEQGVTEEIINEVVSGDQNEADIDNFPRDEGGYVVVWQDTEAPGEKSGWDIVAQILPEAGPGALPQSDSRILVNTTVSGNQSAPSVVAHKDGTFMVAWEHDGGGDEDPEIYAQAFKPDGSKFGTEFLVNTNVPGDQRYPALARLAGTGTVATWSSKDQVENWDVFNQRFDKNFAKNGAEKLTNDHVQSIQSKSAVAGFGGVKAGAYVAVWESFGQDVSSIGVVLNLFDKDGKAVYNADVLVNELVQTGSQRDPSVAVTDDNHFIVVWETQGLPTDDSLEGIAGKVFDANGSQTEINEFVVNQDLPDPNPMDGTTGKQTNPDVAAIPGNGYVVVWLTNPGGNNYSIKGRVFKVE